MNDWRPGKHSSESYPAHVELEVDVCIIGAGAGGSAAAAALTGAGLTVAVLEEGSHWRPSDFRQETSFAFKHLYHERGRRVTRGNVVMPLPGGRGVGGSTLINSAICFRTPPSVMKEWREQYGCERVTDDRFNGYFDRIWKTIGVTVNPVAVQRNNNLIFKQGAEALGLKGEFMARSAPGCVGCGICQYGCPTGGKFSVDRTFMAEALGTNLVGVYADCRVSKVETVGDRVVAVSGQTLHPDSQRPQGSIRVSAKTFVLSAGPIGSPLFLLANGLADSTHCGQHMVVHPTCGLLARFEQEIRPWSGVTQGYYVDCWEKGFLLQTYSVTPDQYFLLLQTRIGKETLEYLSNLSHIASAGSLVHDTDSGGSVRQTPLGPDLYYHFGEGDKSRLMAGTRLCAEVFLAAGALEVMPAMQIGRTIKTKADILSAIPDDLPANKLLLYASHPMGTCRMGASRETSVIDASGKVWDWANLHVADASMFPTSLGVNPQVTTMAMGLMVGEAIAHGS